MELFSIVLFSVALMAPGFLFAWVLRFRSRTWGAVVLSLGMVIAVSGWMAAFSVAGLALVVCGLFFIGVGLAGMRPASRRA